MQLVPMAGRDGVFEGPIEAAICRADIEPVLVPTLRPGDVVVLDNLPAHRHHVQSIIPGSF
jgi:hypothetical protein